MLAKPRFGTPAASSQLDFSNCRRYIVDPKCKSATDNVAKAVLTYSPTSPYDDDPSLRYHFPKNYRSRAEQALGDLIVYYMPRRAQNVDPGTRRSYFGVARLARVFDDPVNRNMCYAAVDNYIDFIRNVSYIGNGLLFESAGQIRPGVANPAYFQNSIRIIPDEEYELIFAAGLGEVVGEMAEPDAQEPAFALAEDQAPFERAVVDQLTKRPFRDEAFRRLVQAAYGQTCAFTGIKIINGGGRAEVEAAHIRPVEKEGPDSVRNGIALSRTVHWMFDRGLISIGDDFSILVSDRPGLPDGVLRLFNPTKRAIVLSDASRRPGLGFLDFHRQQIFKG